MSGLTCTKPPLARDSLPATFELIRSWIDKCLSDHGNCEMTLSGETVDEDQEPILPKRVLAIQTNLTTSHVRLVVTDGLRGHYATLSYCWGPPEKHPLKTTKTNILAHLNGIDFNTLSKTVQNAIVVARGVGLSYLWVDSLCIVQDDKEDWRQESALMGSIYERARLTIAASGSQDPTEGCFRSKRPTQAFVQVPCYSGTDWPGLFHISLLPSGDPSPIWSPLAKRGWAFQEWRLSRRVVHFTKAGLTWVCKTVQCDEREHHRDVQQYPEWYNILEDYTGRELTYETDRLIALEGLVKEMEKATTERFCLGIWTSGLPEQLLWMIYGSTPMEKPLDLPSWTWASKPGRKSFYISSPDFDECRKRTCGEISFKHKNKIRVHGGMKKCTVSTREASAEDFPHRGYGSFLKEGMRDYREGAIQYIQDTEKQSEALLGLAALDGDFCYDPFCLFLMSTNWEHPIPPYLASVRIRWGTMVDTEQLQKEVSLSIKRH
jgi:Heterokaryon incompatibility protein (HET)